MPPAPRAEDFIRAEACAGQSLHTHEVMKTRTISARGIAEALINALDSLPRPRAPLVVRFRGSAVGLPKVGDELNVNTVFEGSVRKAGTRNRRSARTLQKAVASFEPCTV